MRLLKSSHARWRQRTLLRRVCASARSWPRSMRPPRRATSGFGCARFFSLSVAPPWWPPQLPAYTHAGSLVLQWLCFPTGQPEQALLLSRRCAEGWPVRGCEPLPVARAGHAGGRGGCGQGAHAGAGVGGQGGRPGARPRGRGRGGCGEQGGRRARPGARAGFPLGRPPLQPCSRQPLPACMHAGGPGAGAESVPRGWAA